MKPYYLLFLIFVPTLLFCQSNRNICGLSIIAATGFHSVPEIFSGVNDSPRLNTYLAPSYLGTVGLTGVIHKPQLNFEVSYTFGTVGVGFDIGLINDNVTSFRSNFPLRITDRFCRYSEISIGIGREYSLGNSKFSIVPSAVVYMRNYINFQSTFFSLIPSGDSTVVVFAYDLQRNSSKNSSIGIIPEISAKYLLSSSIALSFEIGYSINRKSIAQGRYRYENVDNQDYGIINVRENHFRTGLELTYYFLK